MSGKSHYITAFDGLRAFAVLAVVAYHMNLKWAQGGLLGVTVLFVLSGYLITSLLLVEYRKSGTIDLAGFWRRRVRRLMPSVIVVVAVTAAVATLANHVLLTKMRPDVVPGLLMVINWTKIFSNVSYFQALGAPSPLTHFWSLAIEAQFYLVWPPVLMLLMRGGISRKGLAIATCGLAIASVIAMEVLYVPDADPSRVYYGTDTRAFSLLAGAALAIVWPMGRMSRRPSTGTFGLAVNVGGAAGMAGLVAMVVLTEGYSAFSYRFGILLCTLVTCLVVAAMVPGDSVFSRVCSLPPLRWLGTRSYAIYLWHYPVIQLMTNRNSTTAPSPFWLLLELAISLGLAELSYRYVEEPLRSVGVVELVRERVGERFGGVASWLRARIVVVLATAAVVVVGVVGLVVVPETQAIGADAANGGQRVSAASLRKPLVDGVYDVVLVGDSVAMDAADELNNTFAHGLIDCRIGRQAGEAWDVMTGYIGQGVVGDTVIYAIGTNGNLTPDILDGLVEAVPATKTVWFINNRMPDSFCDQNNAYIAELPSRYSNVHVIDWYSYSAGHDEWFWQDGTHCNPTGASAYAQMVVDAIGYVAPTQENTTYDVTFIGGDVSLGAADKFAATFTHGIVDCAQGRTPTGFKSVFDGYRDKGVVGSTVTLAFGDSADMLKRDEVSALFDDLASVPSVWVVNERIPGSWCDENNALLVELAATHPNIHIIDWYTYSAGHDDWFAGDGMHLTTAGADSYAAFVTSQMAYVSLDDAAGATATA